MNIKAIRLTPACIKTLTKVEVDPKSSHQHEFNGVLQLKEIFGLDKKISMPFFLFGAPIFLKPQM